MKWAFVATLCLAVSGLLNLIAIKAKADMTTVLKSAGLCSYCLSSFVIFGWVVAATVIRFKHTGQVCAGVVDSGDLQNVEEPPYMPSTGLFLKVIVVLLWVIPLTVALVCVVFV